MHAGTYRENSIFLSMWITCGSHMVNGHSGIFLKVLNRESHWPFHKCPLKTHICLRATLKLRKDDQWNITHTKAALIAPSQTNLFIIGLCAQIQF